MAANPVRPMTVAEFVALPRADESLRYELHYGEVVPVTLPKFKHTRIQRRLVKLLDPLIHSGEIQPEFPFRAVAEYDLRCADVAYVSAERWEATDPDSFFLGAPDVVIEVLSLSNSAKEMMDRELICLENGCKEFWVVEPSAKRVRVSKPDGSSVTYRAGQEIPLSLFGNASISVDEIFA